MKMAFQPNAEVRNEGVCTSTAPTCIRDFHRDTSTGGADVQGEHKVFL